MRPHKVLIVKGGRRIAYHNGSTLPDADIRRCLYVLAREIDLNRVVIHFKGRSERTHGRAYDGMPMAANLDGLRRGDWRYLIVVYRNGRSISWVHTLAHEAAHIEQYRENKPRSEVRADNFANHFQERYYGK